MAYDTKTVKRDGSGITPVPQHFNPTTDDYEAIQGRNGASRVEIYDPDGQPITTSSGKLAVRATDIETLLNDIKGKDFATQTTLAAILAKIIAAPATEAKQMALNALIGEVQASPTANTLLARLKSLEDKIDKITNGTSPASVQLSGSNVAIPVDLQYQDIANPLPVEYLNNRKVEEIVIANAVEIRDTNLFISSAKIINKYKSVVYTAYSTLKDSEGVDAEVELYCELGNVVPAWWTGTEWNETNTNKLKLPLQLHCVLNSYWPEILDRTPFGRALSPSETSIRFSIKAVKVPTSGIISIRAYGVPN